MCPPVVPAVPLSCRGSISNPAAQLAIFSVPPFSRDFFQEEEEEEEEEEAVFIRGVNTNEDSPNAQHAPHRPRTGHRCNECVASVHA